MGWGKLAKKIIPRGKNFSFQKSGNIAILGLSGPERDIVLLRFFLMALFVTIFKKILKFQKVSKIATFRFREEKYHQKKSDNTIACFSPKITKLVIFSNL